MLLDSGKASGKIAVASSALSSSSSHSDAAPAISEAKEDRDNERVMEALWNGVGLQSAFRHDVAEGRNRTADKRDRSQARIEARRAREFSERAGAAIRTQRGQLMAAPVHEPTWTGRRGARQDASLSSGSSRHPRFGRRTNVAFNGVASSNTSSSQDQGVPEQIDLSGGGGSTSEEAAAAQSADLSARLLMSSTSLGAGGIGGHIGPSLGGAAMSSSSLLAQIRSRTGGVEHAHTPENAYEGGARHSSSLSSSRINPRDRLGRALEPSRRVTDEQHYREYRKKIAALLRARGGSTTTDVMLTIAPVQANSHHTLQRSKKLMKLFKRALKKQATLHVASGVWTQKP